MKVGHLLSSILSRSTEAAFAVGVLRRVALLSESWFASERVRGTDLRLKNSPVTLIDYAVQCIVNAELERRFPLDGLVCEEAPLSIADSRLRRQLYAMIREALPEANDRVIRDSMNYKKPASTARERYWVLDPIDGTAGLLAGRQYATALALVEGQEVVLGSMACPRLPAKCAAPHYSIGWIYLGLKNQGAYAHRIKGKGGGWRELQVSSFEDLGKATYCESVIGSHTSPRSHLKLARSLGIVRNPVRVDGQCKYALVARGEVCLYLRFPKKPGYRERVWDHAAGLILVEEAGGRVTDLRGERISLADDYRLKESYGVIASNGSVHDKVVERARALL